MMKKKVIIFVIISELCRMRENNKEILFARTFSLLLTHNIGDLTLDEVEKLLHIGLIKTYHKETANRNSLKGKIIWSKHLAKNIVHQERFYVSFTTYDRNHIMNRVLYKTLKVIPNVTRNSYIANKANTLAFYFPELISKTKL